MQVHKIIKFGKDYQFSTDKILGKGGQGIVFKGQRVSRLQFDTTKIPDEIAIKVITFNSPTQEDQICNQIEANKYLKSPGVVSIYKYQLIDYQGQKAIAIAMQLMEGTLQQMLKQQYKGKPIPINAAIEIFYKIITAYQCIYDRSEQKKRHNQDSQDIIHRDIKPANIFYKHEGTNLKFKIGDLGTVRNHQQSKMMTTTVKLTKNYASPQQLSYKKVKFTNKSDLYAMGVILFQLLNGLGKHPIQVQDPVSKLYCVDYDKNKQLNQNATRNVLKKLGVQTDLIEFIIKCLKRQEQERFSWNHVFSHKIFKKYLPKRMKTKEQQTFSWRDIFRLKIQKKNQPMKEQKAENKRKNYKQQNKLYITPDTTTYAWKEKKYRQDNANQNVCINQKVFFQWLCSSDLPCDGQYVFTIKAIKVSKENQDGKEISSIQIGVMDSKMKGEKYVDTWNDCVYLSLYDQGIYKPNEEQTSLEEIDCSCQQTLQSLPCMIQCHVNRNQNTITWHYNGKDQAKQSMPESWKDGRKICAICQFYKLDDYVEFM